MESLRSEARGIFETIFTKTLTLANCKTLKVRTIIYLWNVGCLICLMSNQFKYSCSETIKYLIEEITSLFETERKG